MTDDATDKAANGVHQPMPVYGYTEQKNDAVLLANEGKLLEERILRYLDKISAMAIAIPESSGAIRNDVLRAVNLGRTNIQTGFMWTIRAIFNPQRIPLPEDKQP